MLILTPEVLPAVIMGGVILLIGGAAALQYFSEKKRREAFAEAALRLGLEYQAGDPGLAREQFSDFPCFCIGHSRQFSNVLRGKLDAEAALALFDFSYVTGNGKSRHTYRQTVAGFHVPGLGLPAFELRPENILHKVGGLFGYQDIDFDASPEFSGKYLLRGKEEAAVRRLFDAAVLNHFALHSGWRVEGQGEWLAVCREGRRVAPADLRNFLDETKTTLCAFRNRSSHG
ncbi:MAG: hypothetical protein NTY77_13435 [Elusimicrobia bacterium]|nr:hypothetical protein [Elusimicrobiota bacterium]